MRVWLRAQLNYHERLIMRFDVEHRKIDGAKPDNDADVYHQKISTKLQDAALNWLFAFRNSHNEQRPDRVRQG